MPIVVTGFEPLDILEGIRRTVLQLESGRHELENAYPRAVPAEGNPRRGPMLQDVFEVTDRAWRGIGMIPGSGWRLSDAYRDCDAEAPLRRRRHPHRRVADLPVAARCCRGSSSRTSARPSARSAPRATRWAPRWSPARAPARPTTCTGGSRRRQPPETRRTGRCPMSERTGPRLRQLGLPGAAARLADHRDGSRRRRRDVRRAGRAPVPARPSAPPPTRPGWATRP